MPYWALELRHMSEVTTSPFLLAYPTGGWERPIPYSISYRTLGKMDNETDPFWQKKNLYIPVSDKNWNLKSQFFIFSCVFTFIRGAIFHSLHLQKSHSFFWSQFSTLSLHGSKTLKPQHITHTSLVANNLNIVPGTHAIWSEMAT